jgi:periplasmic glucans biosynthesis protein
LHRKAAKFCPCCTLLGFLIAGTAPGAAEPARQVPFSASVVQQLARDLAKRPFVPPPTSTSTRWANAGYDVYRDIRFRRERAIWHEERRNFELQLLPAAWLYKFPVSINIVAGGSSRPIAPDNGFFAFGQLAGNPAVNEPPIDLSGFRINGPINRPGVFDEIVVFQGASYFRAVSENQVYGLSARGLAIDTAQPTGEEFPFFRTFWIEVPERWQRYVIVHALLDSPSTTGAYRFRIMGDAPTTVDVEVKLYPRREMLHAGIAPLTSMFLFSGIDRSRISDFRPAVHDSDGLAITNAAGERIWRPLTNPKRLQFSVFTVNNVTGFGLLQRRRGFADYEDLEAQYDRRPSAWIEPRGSWGNGSVQLVEIPSEDEINDNIVAFWQPLLPYVKDHTYDFAYRIAWPADERGAALASVRNTLSGLSNGPERKEGALRYVVEFAGPVLLAGGIPQAALHTTAGRISTPIVQKNADASVRVDFLLTPGDAELAELRLELKRRDKVISEVWLSRWTR